MFIVGSKEGSSKRSVELWVALVRSAFEDLVCLRLEGRFQRRASGMKLETKS